MIHKPILITGAARSRTSMTAAILDICGAWGGEMRGPTPYNKKGMFENAYIVDKMIKPYLIGMGADPMGQKPLPDVDNLAPWPGLKKEIEVVLKMQGYKKGPWFYKCAKMCLIWPVWHEAFPSTKWLVVRRSAAEIADSCMRTPFMRKRAGINGWLKWVAVHEQRFKEMADAGLDVTEVWSGDIIAGKLNTIEKFVKDAGLDWKEDEVRAFIDPSLTKVMAEKEDEEEDDGDTGPISGSSEG